MKMYQVKASGLQPHTIVMTARPASIPAKACPSVMDGASVPRRNAPSTDPEAYDSTASPASSTDCRIHCAAIATPICTTPQMTVQMRDTRISVRSSASSL